MEKKSCCHPLKRVRNEEEYKKLHNRLNRIEGQVRGISKMLEEDAYCIDILNQVAAASSALGSFAKELLTQHLKTCVANDIAKGNTEKIEEAAEAVAKLIG